MSRTLFKLGPPICLVFAVGFSAVAQVSSKTAAVTPAAAEHAASLSESGHCAEALPLLLKSSHVADKELQKRIGLDGVREKAWERGLTVMVMATRGDADMESAALAQLTAQPVAGLIYATINTRLIDAPAALSRAPAVLLNCHVANGALPSVVPGEVAGGHAATDVLIRAGHRRIGYVNGEASMEASRHRLRGYRQALATADLPFDPDLLREGNWQPISGYEAARELMSLKSPPTAIFCANDLMAVGCYEALHELGLRIPDDVAVMGYDDREIAQHLHPPLTTVLLPHFEMGSIAAEILLDAASGSMSRPRQIKVECPIVRRGSV